MKCINNNVYMYIDNGKLRVNNVNASIIKIPEVSRRI